MERHGQVIKVKPDKVEEYKEYHENVWPDVLETIKECNIENYSIFYKDGYLFAYFEYTGDDFEKDMEKMADDPVTQDWWDEVKPLQDPIEAREGGEWWADMEEVFHVD